MINKMSLNGFNYPKLGKFLILGSMIFGLILNIYIYHWGQLPFPSDALQYLGPSSFGTTWGYWAWPDRFLLGIGLRLTTLLVGNIPYGGLLYIAVCSFFIVILSMYIAYRETGYWGAIACYIFLTASNYILIYFTRIYPNQTLALFSLISFYFYYYFNNKNRIFNGVLLAGFFSAFVLFSKITGIIFVAYFTVYTVKKHNFSYLIKYYSGLFLGVFTVLLLFVLVYNWQSLTNSLYLFFKIGFTSNLNARGDNAVSYLPVLLDIENFPVFISLFILIGAYRNSKAKKIYLISFAYIFIIYFIYSFSKRGGPAIPLYVYTAFIFAALGMSVYLTDNLKKDLKNLIKENYLKYFEIIIPFILILFMGIGFLVGYKNYKGLCGMYRNANVKIYFKWFVIFIPLMITVLLALFEYFASNRKRRIIVVFSFLFISSIWFPLVNGAKSINNFYKRKKMVAFHYDNVQLLNKVSQKEFAIYIKNWNSMPYNARIIWVYWTLFNKKYKVKNDYQSMYNTELEIKRNIKYIEKENELKNVISPYILTDSINIIEKYFKKIKKIDTIKHDNQIFYVLAINNK